VSRKKIEKTGSFQAVDEDGEAQTIHVFTQFTEYAPISGAAQWLPGLKSHKMSNGNHVNVNDDGTLEDVHTSRKMRRV
jgi:hypothetical protein